MLESKEKLIVYAWIPRLCKCFDMKIEYMLPRTLERAVAVEVANCMLDSIHRCRASTSREEIKPICLVLVTPHLGTMASSPPVRPSPPPQPCIAGSTLIN